MGGVRGRSTRHAWGIFSSLLLNWTSLIRSCMIGWLDTVVEI